jgi:hypothetical protein
MAVLASKVILVVVRPSGLPCHLQQKQSEHVFWMEGL